MTKLNFEDITKTKDGKIQYNWKAIATYASVSQEEAMRAMGTTDEHATIDYPTFQQIVMDLLEKQFETGERELTDNQRKTDLAYDDSEYVDRVEAGAIVFPKASPNSRNSLMSWTLRHITPNKVDDQKKTKAKTYYLRSTMENLHQQFVQSGLSQTVFAKKMANQEPIEPDTRFTRKQVMTLEDIQQAYHKLSLSKAMRLTRSLPKLSQDDCQFPFETGEVYYDKTMVTKKYNEYENDFNNVIVKQKEQSVKLETSKKTSDKYSRDDLVTVQDIANNYDLGLGSNYQKSREAKTIIYQFASLVNSVTPNDCDFTARARPKYYVKDKIDTLYHQFTGSTASISHFVNNYQIKTTEANTETSNKFNRSDVMTGKDIEIKYPEFYSASYLTPNLKRVKQEDCNFKFSNSHLLHYKKEDIEKRYREYQESQLSVDTFYRKLRGDTNIKPSEKPNPTGYTESEVVTIPMIQQQYQMTAHHVQQIMQSVPTVTQSDCQFSILPSNKKYWLSSDVKKQMDKYQASGLSPYLFKKQSQAVPSPTSKPTIANDLGQNDKIIADLKQKAEPTIEEITQTAVNKSIQKMEAEIADLKSQLPKEKGGLWSRIKKRFTKM